MPKNPRRTDRRPPTAAEARALAHPTRLRIVFACRDRALTNKELAAELGTTPGTIHYHLRPLVAEGFLHAEAPRPGPRGSREQPYRSTGKTWELSGGPGGTLPLRQVGVEELLAADEDDVLETMRLGLTLPPEDLRELFDRLQALADEFKTRSLTEADAEDPEAESVALFVGVHRQRPRSRRTGAG